MNSTDDWSKAHFFLKPQSWNNKENPKNHHNSTKWVRKKGSKSDLIAEPEHHRRSNIKSKPISLVIPRAPSRNHILLQHQNPSPFRRQLRPRNQPSDPWSDDDRIVAVHIAFSDRRPLQHCLGSRGKSPPKTQSAAPQPTKTPLVF